MDWGESGRIGAEAPCPRGDGPLSHPHVSDWGGWRRLGKYIGEVF